MYAYRRLTTRDSHSRTLVRILYPMPNTEATRVRVTLSDHGSVEAVTEDRREPHARAAQAGGGGFEEPEGCGGHNTNLAAATPAR